MPEGTYHLIFSKGMEEKVEQVIFHLKNESKNADGRVEAAESVFIAKYEKDNDPISFDEYKLNEMVGEITRKSDWVKAIGWDEYGTVTLLGCDSEGAYSYVYGGEESYLSYESIAVRWNKGVGFLKLIDKRLFKKKRSRVQELNPHMGNIRQYVNHAAEKMGKQPDDDSMSVVYEYDFGDTIGLIWQWRHKDVEHYLVMYWHRDDMMSIEVYSNPDSIGSEVMVDLLREDVSYEEFEGKYPDYNYSDSDWRINFGEYKIEIFPPLMEISEQEWWDKAMS